MRILCDQVLHMEPSMGTGGPGTPTPPGCDGKQPQSSMMGSSVPVPVLRWKEAWAAWQRPF